jgi:WD40 repeat protein
MSLALLASEENESMIRLASGSFDKTIKIWNVNDGSLLSTLIGHSDRVSSLALLADGNLASGSFDLSINVWNTRTGFQSI